MSFLFRVWLMQRGNPKASVWVFTIGSEYRAVTLIMISPAALFVQEEIKSIPPECVLVCILWTISVEHFWVSRLAHYNVHFFFVCLLAFFQPPT